MRIVIDARAYSWAGIGRYIRNILTHLAQVPHKHEIVVLLGEKDAAAYSGPFSKIIVEDSYYSWREQIVFWRQLQLVEADLWHFTHFNVPWMFSRPYVVTIHDITRFIFPGQKRQRLLQQVAYEALFVHTVQKAKRIITVSESTRNALSTLPIQDLSPATTIYEGVDENFFVPVSALQKMKAKMIIGGDVPYLLYVGVWMSHKNLERVLQAYALVRRRYPRLHLVMTGRPVPGYANLIEVAHRLGVEDTVIFPGFVSDELMPALYAGAECFVFPSLYEGFGLPALEAAACGAPVVTANVSSTRELLLGAAEFVNPESVTSIAAGIEVILQDQNRRELLRRAGRRRAQEYRWRRAAEHHVAVYEGRSV